MGLTMKLWWGFRVVVYASRKEVESSAEGLERLCRRAWAVKSRPLGRVVRVVGLFEVWDGARTE